MKIEDLSVAQKKFLHIYTRRALVDWCAQALVSKDGTFQPNLPNLSLPSGSGSRKELEGLVLDYARAKKWVGKREPPKPTSAGFTSAAGMLKT